MQSSKENGERSKWGRVDGEEGEGGRGKGEGGRGEDGTVINFVDLRSGFDPGEGAGSSRTSGTQH